MAEPSDRWHKTFPKQGEPECSQHKGVVPSAEHGKGKRWLACYRDANGRQHKPCFRTKTEAQNFLDEVAAGTHMNPEAGTQTFREFAKERISKLRIKRSSREYYLRLLENHVFDGPNRGRDEDDVFDASLAALGIGDTPLRKLRKRSTFEDLFAATTLATNSLAIVWGLVKRVLEMAVDDEEIGRNPMRGMQRPKAKREKPDVLSLDQDRAVTAALPEWCRLTGELQSTVGGMRIGEALAFSPIDVDWTSKQPEVLIQRQITLADNRLVFSLPKGGKMRRARITENTRDHLMQYLAAHAAVEVTLPWERNPAHTFPGEPAQGELVTVKLFVTTPAGRALSADTFRDHWTRACKAAKVVQKPGKKSHIKRHGYVSHLLAAGVPITEVAAYIGDTLPVVQETYAHWVPSFETNEGRTWRGLAVLDDYLIGSAKSSDESSLSACDPEVTHEAS